MWLTARQFRGFGRRQRHRANWLVYIWSVNNGLAVEVCGLLQNPGNVVFGGLLRERMTRVPASEETPWHWLPQDVIGNWSTLWVSLILAFSSGCNGVLKKRTTCRRWRDWPRNQLLTLMVGLSGLAASPHRIHGNVGFVSVLLALAGPITAIPLDVRDRRPGLPLGVVGMLRTDPTVHSLLGITAPGSTSAGYWAGLILVWFGSAIYLERTLRRAWEVAGRPADIPVRSPGAWARTCSMAIRGTARS